MAGEMEIGSDKRILIVEDDDENRQFLRALLEADGFHVAVARDGQEALAWLIRHGAPALVLLDVEMPRMSGWEFLQAADRAVEFAGTRVLMLSGRVDHLRILDCIAKPAPPDRLLERIRHHIESPR
jgi:DNA-binding response OmpR family regulator